MAVPWLLEGYRPATEDELTAAGVEVHGNSVVHPVGLIVHTAEPGQPFGPSEVLHVCVPLEHVLINETSGTLSFPNPIE